MEVVVHYIPQKYALMPVLLSQYIPDLQDRSRWRRVGLILSDNYSQRAKIATIMNETSTSLAVAASVVSTYRHD
eukprot:scaffold2633_cov139-Skeletonema_menzelii.AAC.10